MLTHVTALTIIATTIRIAKTATSFPAILTFSKYDMRSALKNTEASRRLSFAPVAAAGSECTHRPP
jgi:hypothetical protein